MINEQLIKNIHTETTKIYEYLLALLNKHNAEKDDYFNEPDICNTILKLEGQTSRYAPTSYFKCQIANKLSACLEILNIIYLPYSEPDRYKRSEFSMKYTFLVKVNKERAFNAKKLNNLIMHYPINPEIANETEEFYNNLMEDVIC